MAQEFTISRVFDAPRETVWRAFTTLEHLKHWWGPKGLVWIDGTLDLRPGGTFHYGMRTPDGQEMWGRWVFLEIVPPERLAIRFSFADRQGNPVHHPMSPTWPLEMRGISTFAAQGNKTLLTTRVVALDADEEAIRSFEAGFDGMTQGFGGTYDQLDAYLVTGRQALAEK